MAGLEMELETAPHFVSNDQADEDLIDYDTDSELQQVSADTHKETDKTPELPEASLESNNDAPGDSGDNPEVSARDAEEKLHQPSNEIDIEHDHLLELDEDLVVEDDGAALNLDTAEQETANGIDYEDEYVDEQGDLKNGHEGTGSVLASAEALETASLPPNDAEPTEIGVAGEEEEITWADHDEINEDTSASNNLAAGQGDEAQHIAESQDDHLGGSNEDWNENAGQEQELRAGQEDGYGEHFDVEHDASNQEELDGEEEIAVNNAGTPTPQDDDANASVNSDYPDIFVQYKGEGFPLFSQGTDGFFSELSILDESIESLLAGLRAELENELASEDELVFQIDEVGLEFSESCSRDILCATTLRQILEIFDLLVKNQDPDSNRTLYTVIFTKPSASRRFEYLVESATAGKGLDEVIHLFGSPNNESNAETSEALDELLGDYDSAMNESGEVGEEEDDEDEGEGDDGAKDHEQQDVQFEVHAGAEETTAEYAEDGSAVEEARDSAGDHEAEPFSGNDGIETGEQISALESAQTLTDAGTSGKSIFFPRTQQTQSLQPHDRSQNDCTLSDFIVTYRFTEADELLSAQAESGSNQLMSFDFDEPADTGEVDYEDQPEATTEADQNDASTTSTLQNDGEVTYDPVHDTADTNGDPDPTADVQAEQDDQDELSEIDWRDEGDSTEPAPETPSGTSKRARPEDEPGVGDKQDVKRRRP